MYQLKVAVTLCAMDCFINNNDAESPGEYFSSKAGLIRYQLTCTTWVARVHRLQEKAEAITP
jgi:hypothetical protein